MTPVKTTAIPPDYLNPHERDVIADLVFDYLKDQGIKVTAFGWSIEIDYEEGGNNKSLSDFHYYKGKDE